MRRCGALLALLAWLALASCQSRSNGGSTPARPSGDVAAFLHGYFESWSDGDMARYRAHFDPKAVISFAADGKVQWTQNLDEFIDQQTRITQAPGAQATERMLSFEVNVDVAAASVTARWVLTRGARTRQGVDRFTLIRDKQGRWRIVGLVFYYQ